MCDFETLTNAMEKIHKYNNERRLIGIKVKPFVLDALKRQNLKQYREDFSLIDKLTGLDVYVDEDADYPFTPIYNKEQED